MGELKKPVNVGDSFALQYLKMSLQRVDKLRKEILFLEKHLKDKLEEIREIEHEILILQREP